MNTKYSSVFFIVISLIAALLMVGAAILFTQKQKLEKQTATAPETSQDLSLTPSPTPVLYTGAVSFDECGTQNIKSKFSLTLPEKWSIQKTSNFNEAYQGYLLNGPQGWISITCFKSFTPGPCSENNTKTVSIGSQTTTACLDETKSPVTMSFADIKSSQGNTFDFGAQLTDKQVLGQILSTFKFD